MVACNGFIDKDCNILLKTPFVTCEPVSFSSKYLNILMGMV